MPVSPTLQQLIDKSGGKALLTGGILGLMLKAESEGKGLLGVLDVKPILDSDGNYLPQLEVTMRSGTYRIAVIDEHLIEEEDVD